MNHSPNPHLRGKARLRSEIIEMTQALHKIGVISDKELAETSRLMTSRVAHSKAPPMSPAEIIALRETQGLTRDGMAALLNVSTSTVSQWERGVRRPTGAALKLLHVVKQNGVAALA